MPDGRRRVESCQNERGGATHIRPRILLRIVQQLCRRRMPPRVFGYKDFANTRRGRRPWPKCSSSSSRAATTGRTFRSRSSSPDGARVPLSTAPRRRYRRAGPGRACAALAKPALGSLATAYVRGDLDFTGSARRMLAIAGSRWWDRCRTAATARARLEAYFNRQCRTAGTSRTTTTSPTRSIECGWMSGWCTRARISGTTATRSTRRSCKSSTTSAAQAAPCVRRALARHRLRLGRAPVPRRRALWRRCHRHHAVAKPVRLRDGRRSRAACPGACASNCATISRPARGTGSTTRWRAWACSSTWA